MVDTTRRPSWLTAALAVVAVLLGGFAVWSASRAGELRDTAAARNSAHTDAAATSELKGQIGDAVGTVFSYSYTDTGKTERAAQRLLTGKAITQYNAMFATIRKQAPAQKLVLTTTVTDSGVRTLEGDRARLLVFADQRSTRTDTGQTSYSAAMFTVGAIRTDGRWKIENLDTFKG